MIEQQIIENLIPQQTLAQQSPQLAMKAGAESKQQSLRPQHSDFSKLSSAQHIMALLEKGIAQVQYHLARCYQLGIKVKKDEKEAVRRYRLAAAQGSPKALYRLGWCYENGAGVTQDYVNAIKLYRMAAAAPRGNISEQKAMSSPKFIV